MCSRLLVIGEGQRLINSGQESYEEYNTSNEIGWKMDKTSSILDPQNEFCSVHQLLSKQAHQCSRHNFVC